MATVCGSYLNRSNIVVGVVSTGEFSEAKLQAEWGPTFETYLTESVGLHLIPPRNFSLVLMSIANAFDMVDEKEIDFIFATPSIFSCLELENSGNFYYFAVVSSDICGLQPRCVSLQQILQPYQEKDD
jgi:hypothetical protein